MFQQKTSYDILTRSRRYRLRYIRSDEIPCFIYNNAVQIQNHLQLCTGTVERIDLLLHGCAHGPSSCQVCSGLVTVFCASSSPDTTHRAEIAE